MKVLVFNLNARGGMLHYSSQMCNALCKQHEVTVVLPTYTDFKTYSKDVNVFLIQAPNTIGGTIIESLKFWKFFKDLKYFKSFDKVIIMDNHPWYLWFGRIFKKKLVVIQHDPQLHMGDLKGFHRWITQKVNVKLRKWANKVFVHGQKLKEQITDVPQEKVQTIYHGHYGLFKRETYPKTLEGDVLFFGRILDYKGIDIFLRAATYLPDFKFTIAGEGPLPNNLPSNVQVKNEFIPDEEVGGYFVNHKIVALPYKEASQTGIVPIAYSFNMPAIVTNVGALPDMVVEGKTGLIIEPDSVEELVLAIKKLLPNKYKDMRGACKSFLEEKLDWDKISYKVVTA